jgi:radical SAM protein with 4Fe4S-binding SPASM domain
MLKKILKRFPYLFTSARQLYPFITVFPALLAGRRGSRDHLRSSWSLFNRAVHITGRPINITIEPTNSCNLACPVCETGSATLGRLNRSMPLIEFREIIGKISAHTNTLMLYFMGEPFLNPDIYQMIRCAKEAGIPWVTTCTNGEVIDPQQLVSSGIDEVNFQIGGMSQGTHGNYRVNGNLELVLTNLREMVRLKRDCHAPLRIVCGMILMRHNEHEVKIFEKVMAQIGIDEAVVVDPCVRTIEQAKRYLPRDQRHWYYDPVAFAAGILRPRFVPQNRCPWIYYSLVIQANGDVVPCCRDASGKFVMGNLLTQGLDEIWNGERFKKFRSMLLADQPGVSICNLCSSYPASRIR